MEKQNGVTLTSLVIYVAVMIIVLGMMSTIIASFYGNTTNLEWDVQQIVEFNKFNTFFLKEIKTTNNSVDDIGDTYIVFKSGNSFSISDNAIYYNNLKICNDVKSMQIALGENGDGNDKTIIYITLSFENFSKSINYKIENIY